MTVTNECNQYCAVPRRDFGTPCDSIASDSSPNDMLIENLQLIPSGKSQVKAESTLSPRPHPPPAQMLETISPNVPSPRRSAGVGIGLPRSATQPLHLFKLDRVDSTHVTKRRSTSDTQREKEWEAKLEFANAEVSSSPPRALLGCPDRARRTALSRSTYKSSSSRTSSSRRHYASRTKTRWILPKSWNAPRQPSSNRRRRRRSSDSSWRRRLSLLML